MGVVINAGRLDFDAKLDFTKLKDACGGTLTMHNDSTPTPAQIAERAKGHAVVISKEEEDLLINAVKAKQEKAAILKVQSKMEFEKARRLRKKGWGVWVN